MMDALSMDAVRALALALDAKDPLTRNHSDRVARYSLAVGAKLGLGDEQLQALAVAGLLHDIGILGVPEAVLQKNGALSPHELQQMREHSVIGERILEGSGLAPIARLVRHHHERIDGGGYPDGLKADAIPIESRIIGVVEALEAMTADRYGTARGGSSAMDELDAHRGTQFDPAVTEVLLDLLISQELDEVAFEDEMADVIRNARLHDPEWIFSRQAARRQRLSSVTEIDLETLTPDA